MRTFDKNGTSSAKNTLHSSVINAQTVLPQGHQSGFTDGRNVVDVWMNQHGIAVSPGNYKVTPTPRGLELQTAPPATAELLSQNAQYRSTDYMSAPLSAKSTKPEPPVNSTHMQTATAHEHQPDKRHPKPDQKRLRAAEARYKYELLQEARTLQDHLADFWDLRFDKYSRFDTY